MKKLITILAVLFSIALNAQEIKHNSITVYSNSSYSNTQGWVGTNIGIKEGDTTGWLKFYGYRGVMKVVAPNITSSQTDTIPNVTGTISMAVAGRDSVTGNDTLTSFTIPLWFTPTYCVVQTIAGVTSGAATVYVVKSVPTTNGVIFTFNAAPHTGTKATIVSFIAR
jgi:hypothetical protein